MKHFILFLISLSVLQTFAQVRIDTTKYIDIANSGTIKQITSKDVCAIVVFVSGPDNGWDIGKKKKVLGNDKKSFKKLKKELMQFNIDFKIHFEVFNLKEDFKIDSIVDFNGPVVNAVEKSSRYGKANLRKIWNHYSTSTIPFFKQKKYLSFDGGYFLIVHHEGAGYTRATASVLNGSKNNGELPEYLTMFEYDQNWKKYRKHVIAHEVLHLYGAWDLYNQEPYGYNKQDYDEIKRRYPKSIMRKSDIITIDPLTAWRIGITNNPENWFLEMVPQAYHKSHNP